MEKAPCRELTAISSDFWELMSAHCPLCNGLGPTCIVEDVRESLGNGDEDAEAAEAAPLSAVARRAGAA